MKKKTLKQLVRQAAGFALNLHGGKPKELLLAHEKRAYERQLRSEGKSRKEAVAMVHERFRNRG